MTNIEVEIEVHAADDVTFTMDTGAFLDAIGPVDRELEDAVNEELDAYVDRYAYYRSENWYSMLYERDSQKVLKTALASALKVDEDELAAEYSFATCNWENHLDEDFGGTLWNTADGRTLLTVESGEHGHMRNFVEVRRVECEEPAYVIADCSSHIMIGCTACDLSIDTAHERVDWRHLTRTDDGGCVHDGLYCPKCGAKVAAEAWI